MELTLQDVSECTEIPGEEEIERWLLAALENKDIQLTVRLVAEEEMSELNQKYRHKKGSTNVLSFPFEDPPGVSSGILGDIVICAPVVKRDRKSTRLNSSHTDISRMPSSA